MRKVTLSKGIFDHVLYTAFNTIPSKNEDQLEISLSVNRKLRDISQPKTPGNNERAMTEEEATLLFEESERNLILERLRASIGNFYGFVDEQLAAAIKVLKEAEEVKVEESQ